MDCYFVLWDWWGGGGGGDAVFTDCSDPLFSNVNLVICQFLLCSSWPTAVFPMACLTFFLILLWPDLQLSHDPLVLRWPCAVNRTLKYFVQFCPFWFACFLCPCSLHGNWYSELCCLPYTEKLTTKTDHITPLFQSLHWLPVQQRIQCKIKLHSLL